MGDRRGGGRQGHERQCRQSRDHGETQQHSRGDAIAGIIITLINILGGLTIGVLQNGMNFGDAAQNYTLLTVGDGLVSQVPALIVSTAAGIIVSRAGSKSSLGRDIT
ncbi:MAG: FHIPEP family type III secretion protein, partial [Desulfobacteraceae bacterium]|nr:FHIPEP family type III secretion protein [Desulfobacteraceae bacterium]